MTGTPSGSGTMARLTEVFRSIFGDDRLELDDGTTADDVDGWDSIAHVSLVFAVEEEFGITLETAALERIESVGDLRAAIDERLA